MIRATIVFSEECYFVSVASTLRIMTTSPSRGGTFFRAELSLLVC